MSQNDLHLHCRSFTVGFNKKWRAGRLISGNFTLETKPDYCLFMFWTADKGQIKSQVYESLCVSLVQMDFSSNKFRSYVYTGFELDKSAIQLIEDLRKVFGVDAAPWLRTVQPWIGTIKDGSISIEKNVSLGRPELVRVPKMTSKVEHLVPKCPRILLWGLWNHS